MLRETADEDLDAILEWRNQDEVRLFSLSQHIISKQEHYAWWQKIKDDKSKRWMIFNCDQMDMGVVNFYNIKPKNEAYWGFYLAPFVDDYQRLKYWLQIEQSAIAFASDELELSTLKCEVLCINRATLMMHKKFGFKEINRYQHDCGEVLEMALELQH